MRHLPEFISFEEKSNIFDHSIIDSETQLEEFIFSTEDEHMLYRGVNEAKYKLYTSLQRFWIKNELDPNVELYQEFLIKVINEFKDQNDRLFAQYMELFKTKFIEYGILSTIQHHGGLTPLLDFTEAKEMALYFAIQQNEYNVQTNLIDKYCSVYVTKKGKVSHTTDYFTKVNSKILHERPQIIEDARKHLAEVGISEELADRALEQTHVENLGLLPLMNQWKAGLIADIDEINDYGFGTRSNLNIIIQKGVFLFNYHPVQTLEESMDEFLVDTLMLSGMEAHKIEENRNRIKHFKCYDIHKSLIPKLKKYLEDSGIVSSKLFPNIRAMVEMAQKKVLVSMVK